MMRIKLNPVLQQTIYCFDKYNYRNGTTSSVERKKYKPESIERMNRCFEALKRGAKGQL